MSVFNFIATHAKKQFAKMTGGYSPFLVVSKPMIDITKRAKINQQVKERLEQEADLIEPNEDISHLKIELTHQLKNHHNKKLSELVETYSTLASRIVQQFTELGYEVTPLKDGQFVVQLNKIKSLVQLPQKLNTNIKYDNTWHQAAIAKLDKNKNELGCDAAMYLTPGITSRELRTLEKASDTFVMSGWDFVYFYETSLS